MTALWVVVVEERMEERQAVRLLEEVVASEAAVYSNPSEATEGQARLTVELEAEVMQVAG